MTPEPPSASTSARAAARDQLTRVILESARSQLGTVGPAQLSVRAVARDVGMVSSAVYRYFPSRDDLLTALLVVGYDEVGEAVEQAVAAVPADDLAGRWLALARAFRRWAVAHRWDYALLYGSPVPGYAAPQLTVQSAARAPRVLMDLLLDLPTPDRSETPAPEDPRAAPVRHDPALRDPALDDAVAGLRAFAGPDLPDAVLVRGMAAWSGLVGAVTLELFGHLANAVLDHETYFETLARQLSPVPPTSAPAD